MKLTKQSDIILNVISPLFLGLIIYLSGGRGSISVPIKNHIPDGLWAYSFISVILVIWDRRFNFFWIGASFLLAAGFEFFQHWQLIAGTADIVDVIVYFVFIGLGLLVNSYFRKKYCALLNHTL